MKNLCSHMLIEEDEVSLLSCAHGMLVIVRHLRALIISDFRGILVEPALLVILARLQGLAPCYCSLENETYLCSICH